jgi:RNA polymerase sigma-70 factor (ECF subfamily)
LIGRRAIASRAKLAYNEDRTAHQVGTTISMSANSAAFTRPDADHQLVRQVAARDERAFDELYRSYSAAVYGYLLHLVNEPAVAEDLLQEVFLAAWQGADRFRAEARVKTWLLRIAHHQAVSWLRRRRPAVALDDLAEAVADDTAEEALAYAWRADEIRAALERLSANHRAVIELTFMHDLSYTEIAEIMDCPIGTVKSRMSYALRHLDRVLAAARQAADGA